MFSFGVSPNGDHMHPSYLVIKRQKRYNSMSSYLLLIVCSLPNLMLNPSYASKIGTHVPMWICLQACLKVQVKSISDSLDNYWSPSCNKLCFSTLFNNYNSYLFATISNFVILLVHLSFISFSNFLCSCFVHGFFL
jgi:hypothetical protein